MQKMSFAIKQIIIFLALAFTVPWLNMAAFFAFVSHYGDTETLELLEENSSAFYNRTYTLSLYTFILTYIIAKQLINKKTHRLTWRLFWYIITDIFLFFAICCLP